MLVEAPLLLGATGMDHGRLASRANGQKTPVEMVPTVRPGASTKEKDEDVEFKLAEVSLLPKQDDAFIKAMQKHLNNSRRIDADKEGHPGASGDRGQVAGVPTETPAVRAGTGAMSS